MRIMLVDDDSAGRAAVSWFLKSQGHEVTECASGEQALELLLTEEYPMVLSDIQMPLMTGIELLEAIKKRPDSWRTDVVLFTGFADVESAVAALRAGAYDYLCKPVDAQMLSAVVERIAEHQALLRENKVLTENFDAEVQAATEENRRELSRIRQQVREAHIGKVGVFSPTTEAVVKLAQKFHYDRAIPILIEGETGTGKEIIARMVHYGENGTDIEAPFVDVNCAAIAPGLFESELFGYEAGAYTGSSSRGQKGKFDMAYGGTLFLDEVGEIPLELQGKLLRVLQEKEFYRVGGLKKIRTDARIICASNVPLAQKVENGTFRKDLYYRINVGHIQLPPLKARRAEIEPLAKLFLQDFARQKHKQFSTISPEAVRILAGYDWPGNVRELKNAMEFAVFMYDDEELRPSHLGAFFSRGEKIRSQGAAQDTKHIVLPFPEKGYSLKQYNDDIIKEVLAKHDGNQTATAGYLGISLRALAYRLAQMRE